MVAVNESRDDIKNDIVKAWERGEYMKNGEVKDTGEEMNCI